MATDVIREHEVILNSVCYPIIGEVQPRLVSQLPERMIIGDVTKASNPLVSSLIINSGQSGILAEEFEGNPTQVWWANVDMRQKGQIILPPLATGISLGTSISPGWVSPDTHNDPDTAWSDEANAYDDDTGTVATVDTIAINSWSSYLEFSLTTPICCSKVRIYRSDIGGAADCDRTQIDYVDAGGNWVNFYDDDPTDEDWTEASLTTTQYISKIRIRIYNDHDASAQSSTLCEVAFYRTNYSPSGTATKGVTYNGRLYWAVGDTLVGLNAGGFSFSVIATFTSSITDLCLGPNNCLYIALGDSDEYWYFDSSGDFYQTDESDMTYLAFWNDCLYASDVDGNVKYAATPNDTTPDWTAVSALPLAGSTISKLKTYRDATGSWILYAALSNGLWAFDLDNDKWLQTELSLPEHPNVGKGLTDFQGSLWISAGLNVIAYTAGQVVDINTKQGLDQFGSIPAEYRGEITNLTKGFNEMFATVDASEVTGTSKSWIARYINGAWHPVWLDSGDNKSLSSAAISSDEGYRYWWARNDDTLYYITLQRDAANPKKDTAYKYAGAGALITSTFHGEWEGGVSRALALKVETDDMSEDETITVRYRKNYAFRVVSQDEWSTLGTISSDGLTTYKFPNNSTPYGSVFREIQFRFDLACGYTNTNSPILCYFVFEYQKVVPTAWGWGFTVDCTQSHDGKSPDQMMDALKTVVETTTLVGFTYDDETKYVEVVDVSASKLTGEGRKGIYNVVVRAPQ